jgi:hypothetical protein
MEKPERSESERKIKKLVIRRLEKAEITSLISNGNGGNN